jgi:hypothetical protein
MEKFAQLESSVPKEPRFPPYPSSAGGDDASQYEAQDEWYETVAAGLDGGEVDTLIALIRSGPLFDGDVPSKAGRNSLMDLELCTKVVVSGRAQPNACPAYKKPAPLAPLADQADGENGYTSGHNAATMRGARVYKALIRIRRIEP